MARRVRYYLGRVGKFGRLNDQLLIDAIRAPVVTQSYGAHFTFTQIFHNQEPEYVVAHLSKFEPEGEVPVVRLEKHLEDVDSIPGLLVAASRFVFLPEFSGLAYQHVWNRIERPAFERVFAKLVEEKYDRFMVGCGVEALSDLRTFVQRVAALDQVEAIRARVHQPNPSFSPLWRSLREYISKRRARELRFEEEAQPQRALETSLPAFARGIEEMPEDVTKAIEEIAGPDGTEIGDAVVLMAADGYGKATVEGTENGRRVIVRTKETQLAFKFDRDAEPEALYEAARARFLAASKRGGLRH